jgi:outer membrane protein OmpA-like peptidoglycan-associated protein
MARVVNRTAILINLGAFVAFSVFCVSTQAPLIQQDILKRCQDALLIHKLPIEGLSVDGRDVVLSGPPESEIISAQARTVLSDVRGVREIRVWVLPESQAATGVSAQQRKLQNKIDGVLEKQPIAFRTDSAMLTPESETALQQIAAYLAESPTLLCEIRGYDKDPSESRQNWVLALQRALSTEDYLVSNGIAEWRLSTRAFQSGEAVADRRHGDRVVDLVVRAR